VIAGMAGEVCIEYALFIRSISKAGYVIVSGYCNGTVGYIPTAAMFEEGGYEPLGSYIYYLYPSPFSKDVEIIIKKALLSLFSS
jgi:hypothetical protein